MSNKLTMAEIASPAWQKVRAELHQRLEAARMRVENPRELEAERLGLCWRINELKALLELEQPERNPDAD